MAIASTTVWEARTTGLSTNGGGFDPVLGVSAVDYSQQDSPQLALVDIAIANNTTTTITSATGGFTSSMIGNVIYLTGGSGGTLATQRRQITAVTDTNTATVDQAPAPSSAMTGVTGNLGGAVSAPWDVYSSTAGSNDFVLGNTLYIKSGTYTRTSNWTGKDLGGPGTLTNQVHIVGYDTDRSLWNSTSNRPVITTSTNSITLFIGIRMTGYYFVKNLVFSNTASTRGVGISNTTAASSCNWINCKFIGFTIGLNGTSSVSTQVNGYLINCEISNCTSFGANSGTSSSFWYFFGCYIHDNGWGILLGSVSAGIIISNCLIVNNNYGIVMGASTGLALIACESTTIANNTTAQLNYSITSDPPSNIIKNNIIRNCIFYGGQYGIYHNSSGSYALDNLTFGRYKNYNAFGGSSIANLANTNSTETDITLTSDPFMDSANRDYRLKKNAGGGYICKNAGLVSFPGLENISSYSNLGSYEFVPATLTL